MRHERYGTVVFVDLSSGRTTTRFLGSDVTRRYLGGSGLGVRLLMELCDPAIHPLDPQNPLIFAPGLLTGTLVPGATKTSVVAKSPLTGIFGESSVGGSWGAEYRFTGFDALVVIGAAHEPVYLWICDNHVQIDRPDTCGAGIPLRPTRPSRLKPIRRQRSDASGRPARPCPVSRA